MARLRLIPVRRLRPGTYRLVATIGSGPHKRVLRQKVRVG